MDEPRIDALAEACAKWPALLVAAMQEGNFYVAAQTIDHALPPDWCGHGAEPHIPADGEWYHKSEWIRKAPDGSMLRSDFLVTKHDYFAEIARPRKTLEKIAALASGWTATLTDIEHMARAALEEAEWISPFGSTAEEAAARRYARSAEYRKHHDQGTEAE